MKKGIVFLTALLPLLLLAACLRLTVPIEQPTKSDAEKTALRETAKANETYLKAAVNGQMTIAEMIDVFETMCDEKVEDDSVLFETGAFDFTGEPAFYFSVVRQFPDGENEYYQVHLDILFQPDEINKNFKDVVWSNFLEDESIFDFIRSSDAFVYAAAHAYQTINIYWDET